MVKRIKRGERREREKKKIHEQEEGVVDTVCRSVVQAEIVRLTSRFLRENGPTTLPVTVVQFSSCDIALYNALRSDSENLRLLRILHLLSVLKKKRTWDVFKDICSVEESRRNFQFLAVINPKRTLDRGRERRGKRKGRKKRKIKEPSERVYPGMASWKTVIPWIRSAGIQSDTFSLLQSHFWWKQNWRPVPQYSRI